MKEAAANVNSPMRSLRSALLLAFLCALFPAAARSQTLPQTLSVLAPFPHIDTDASERRAVAPGVSYASYHLRTSLGPLSVHVLAVDPKEPTLRIDTVLASDRIISKGETVSSMAHRTGAVAGINGDYFDIGNTNQPLNILIRGGRLLRMPMQRYALALDNARVAHIAEYAFGGSIDIGGNSLRVNALNDWPQAGITLITPEFGNVAASEDATLVRVQPLSGTPPFGTFRVIDVADNTAMQPPGYYIGIGSAAYAQAGVPNPGDTIAVRQDFKPSIETLTAAIGGGPLLLKDGAPYSDPDGPNTGEFRTHMPVSGAGIRSDGTLLFFEVDGRQPELSIGVTQPEFAALMRAFGAVDAMAFDAGGSATMVTRVPGDEMATVRNSPSDGRERPIADGLFFYSDAPRGPASRLEAFPQTVRAVPGASVEVRVAAVDSAEHPAPGAAQPQYRVSPASLGTMDGNTFTAKHAGEGILAVRRGALSVDIPLSVEESPARIDISPAQPNASRGERLQLRARAFDARGYEIALPNALGWSAGGAAISQDGILTAGDRDATVAVRIGAATAQTRVTVGQHESELQLGATSFSTAPRNGPGELVKGVDCPTCLGLAYDFTGNERAAYVQTDVTMPKAIGVTFDVLGDGNGEYVRVALDNAINERVLLTAGRVGWNGWRTMTVKFPASLPQPARLRSIYVLKQLNEEAPPVRGRVVIRNVRMILAGSGNQPRQ